MGKMKALAMDRAMIREMEEYQEMLGQQAIEEQREMEPLFPESSAQYDKRLEREAMFNGTTHEDMVNHPPHYNQGGIETIEAIKAALGYGFNAYLTGNILKYLWRYNHKNGVEDVKKAQFYLNRLVQEMDAAEQVQVSGVPYKVDRSSILGGGV